VSSELLAPELYSQLSLDDLTSTSHETTERNVDLELPILSHEEAIVNALNQNQVVLIISPTGTGKSTEVPRIARRAGFDTIRESQPRRRAAQNVANRIISRLAIEVGEEKSEELVSFHTGGGLVGGYNSEIQVMTEGVLNTRDTFDPSDGDNELWILDEAHENSLEMWMTAGFAKQKLAENPNFTVVVMTATPDKYETIDYWTSDTGIEPAVIEVGGGTNYEIEDRVEPESTTVDEAVKAAIDIYENPDAYDGANTVQVFVAGKREIKDGISAMRSKLPPEVLAKTRLLRNHAKLSNAEQNLVYQDFDGIKVIWQTNIGKTSMTVPRTRDVITSGSERMNLFDEDFKSYLGMQASSQDCIWQERGRGGRTSPSRFTLTRQPREIFVPMEDRDPHLLPEILRSDLDHVVMRLAVRGQNIRTFPGKPMPPTDAIDRAMTRLQTLGALDEYENLTQLGRRMAKYPVSPEYQRCLAEAEQYSVQIRLSMAAMVASAEAGGLRLFESGSPVWEKLTDETSSDMFAHLEMFIAIQRKRVNGLVKDDIDMQNVTRAEELYRKIARRSGIDNIPALSVPSVEDRRILKECIVQGFLNEVYVPEGREQFRAIDGAVNPRQISNRSVVSRSTTNAVVAKPYGIEVDSDIKHLLGTVTEIPQKEMGKLLVHLTRWEHEDFRLRGGKFVQVQRQRLGQRALGIREIPAEPSPLLRAAVIDKVKVDPGKHLIELYKIKSALEKLANRSKNSIPMLTEDKINDLIAEAAPDGVNSPDHVNENLRRLIEEKGITIDTFVTKEHRERIMQDAPDKIKIEEFGIRLRYSRRKPIITNPSWEMISGLQEEPTLPDGRQIYFQDDGKPYTLLQMKQLYGI
jgi:HrpA-like RNA helicase